MLARDLPERMVGGGCGPGLLRRGGEDEQGDETGVKKASKFHARNTSACAGAGEFKNLKPNESVQFGGGLLSRLGSFLRAFADALMRHGRAGLQSSGDLAQGNGDFAQLNKS